MQGHGHVAGRIMKYIIPERDKIDRRIVSETANGTYSTNASKGGGYGLIDSQEDTIEKVGRIYN